MDHGDGSLVIREYVAPRTPEMASTDPNKRKKTGGCLVGPRDGGLRDPGEIGPSDSKKNWYALCQ